MRLWSPVAKLVKVAMGDVSEVAEGHFHVLKRVFQCSNPVVEAEAKEVLRKTKASAGVEEVAFLFLLATISFVSEEMCFAGRGAWEEGKELVYWMTPSYQIPDLEAMWCGEVVQAMALEARAPR